MRLLLDTQILIALARRELPQLAPTIVATVNAQDNVLFASAASSWEIAIKTRLGKINPGIDLDDLPAYWEVIGLNSSASTIATSCIRSIPNRRREIHLISFCLLNALWKTCAL
jgi:PIN domain nuclease of toxin-antitoxin system